MKCKRCEKLERDILDMQDAHKYLRCKVCKRLSPDGCCYYCGRTRLKISRRTR